MSVNSVICVEVIYLSDRWQRNDLFLSSDCRLTPVLLQGLYFFYSSDVFVGSRFV